MLVNDLIPFLLEHCNIVIQTSIYAMSLFEGKVKDIPHHLKYFKIVKMYSGCFKFVVGVVGESK